MHCLAQQKDPQRCRPSLFPPKGQGSGKVLAKATQYSSGVIRRSSQFVTMSQVLMEDYWDTGGRPVDSIRGPR